MRPNRWQLQRTVEPTGSVLTLPELKAHLRILDDAEDSLLAVYGAAAENALEHDLGIALLQQTWVLRIDRFPACWEIRLPRSPLQSVSSVEYVDGNGAVQVLASSEYVVDTTGPIGRLYLGYGKSWPSTRDEPGAVRITYVAGRAATVPVPDMLRLAIWLMAGDLYEHRERSAEQVLHELALYGRLLAAHRLYWEPNYE